MSDLRGIIGNNWKCCLYAVTTKEPASQFNWANYFVYLLILIKTQFNRFFLNRVYKMRVDINAQQLGDTKV